MLSRNSSILDNLYPPTDRLRSRKVTDAEWLMIQLSRMPSPRVPDTQIQISILRVQHLMIDLRTGRIPYWELATPYTSYVPMEQTTFPRHFYTE